jgi:hypothetical protein
MAKGTGLFDDPDWREYLIELLSRGWTKTAALKECGMAYGTFYKYLQNHPDFKQQIEDTITDRAMRVIGDIMVSSDDDKTRLAAADKVVQHTRTAPTAVEHRHVHELTASPEVTEILELQRKLQERMALEPGPAILEGTVIEEENE